MCRKALPPTSQRSLRKGVRIGSRTLLLKLTCCPLRGFEELEMVYNQYRSAFSDL